MCSLRSLDSDTIVIVFQTRAEDAWNATAKFMAHGQGNCVLENFYPMMAYFVVSADCYGMVAGCVINFVSVDSSRKGLKEVIHKVALPPYHHEPKYHDVRFADLHSPPTLISVISTFTGAKILNAVDEQTVPHNSRKGTSLFKTDK